MRSSPSRRGFTLIEMMMAVMLTMLVFAITIPFFRAQTRAVDAGAGRLDATQNARYAQNAIDRELRLAGGIAGQPIIVQADKFSITFNADIYGRSLSADPNAVFINTALDTLTTDGFRVGAAKTLPTSSKTYPTATYTDSNGTVTKAETISFFLVADASTGRTDLYKLYRRVNGIDSTVVTSNLYIPADTGYFFRYYKAGSSGTLTMIDPSGLPLYWDDGARTIDSIAVVEMRIAGFYRDVRNAKDIIRTIYERTKINNVGRLTAVSACGAAPASPSSVTLSTGTNAGGSITYIRTSWTASTDDTSSGDVAAYNVARRPSGGGSWVPVGSVPATAAATYTFDDYAPAVGTWTYGVVAVDCTPGYSSAATSATNVTFP